MRLLKPKLNQDGFTIVELIVAMLVGASLVGTVQVIYTNQTYLSQRARDLTIANSYAEGKIESLRSAGYLTLSNGTTDITSELPNELNDTRSASMQITSPQTGIKKVAITISFNAQGASRTETYTTFIGELGVGQY